MKSIENKKNKRTKAKCPNPSTNIFFNETLEILKDFISFTNLHGVKNIIEDFKYLDKPSTKARLSKG